MASVGTLSMDSHAPASQVRLHWPTLKFSWLLFFSHEPLQVIDSISERGKPRFKCPPNQKREGHSCYFCLLVFRATTHINRQAHTAAYPLLLSEQRHYCDPHLPPLWNVEGTAVSLILSWWWWGTAVLLMRFFSRSAIYIWDRRPPFAPHLAIEPVELMQEGEGGFPTRENRPTVSRPHSHPPTHPPFAA